MSFPLNLCNTDNRPLLGRFSDPVALDKVIQPVKLYSQQETILEDEADDDIVKDGAYWAKRKKHRRTFHSKKEYFIEDSSISASTGKPSFRFEGGVADVNIHTGGSEANDDRDLFRYAILQVTTRQAQPTGGASSSSSSVAPAATPVVNIIPVGDWVNFKKPSVKSADTFLEQVDEEIELHAKEREKANKKYKAITSVLSQGKGQVEGASEIHYFGKGKARGGNKRKMIESLSMDNDDDERVRDDDGEGVGVGFKKVGGMFSHAEDEDQGGGNNAREQQENKDDGDIDFQEQFANDEVLEGIAQEQDFSEGVEQHSKSQKQLVRSGDYIAVGWGDDERVQDGLSDDSEDSDADDEEVDFINGGGSSKMDKLSSYARELKWHAANKTGGGGGGGTAPASSPATAIGAAGASGASGGILKRGRDDQSGDASAGISGDNKRVKVESPPINPLTGRAGNKSASPPISGSGRQAEAAVTSFELTDAGVRAYIKYIGGKVTVPNLAKVSVV